MPRKSIYFRRNVYNFRFVRVKIFKLTRLSAIRHSDANELDYIGFHGTFEIETVALRQNRLPISEEPVS